MATPSKILQINGVREGLSSRDLEPHIASVRGKIMDISSAMHPEFKYTLFAEFESEENASKAKEALGDLKIAGIKVNLEFATPEVINKLRANLLMNKQNNSKFDPETQKSAIQQTTLNTYEQNKAKEVPVSDSKPKEKAAEETGRSRFTDIKVQTVSDIRQQYAYNANSSRQNASAVSNQQKPNPPEIKPYQATNAGYSTQTNQNSGNMVGTVSATDNSKVDPKAVYYNESYKKKFLTNQAEYNTTTTAHAGIMSQATQPTSSVLNSAQMMPNGIGISTLPYTNQGLITNTYPITMQSLINSSLSTSVKPPQTRTENASVADATKMIALGNLAVDSLLATMQEGKNRGIPEDHTLQNPTFLSELLKTQTSIIETLKRQIEVKDKEIEELKKGISRRRSRSRSRSKSRSPSRSRSSYSRRRRSSSRRRHSRSSSDDRSSDSRSNRSSDDSRRYKRRSGSRSRRRSSSRRRSYSRKRSDSRRRSHSTRDRQNPRSPERRNRYPSKSPRASTRRSRDRSRSPYQSSKDARGVNKSRLSPSNHRRGSRSRSRSYSRRNRRSYDRNVPKEEYKYTSGSSTLKIERPIRSYGSSKNEPSKSDRRWGDSPGRRQSPRRRSPSPIKPTDIITNLRPREFALHVQKEREARGSDKGRYNDSDKYDDSHRDRRQRSRSNSYHREKDSSSRPTFMEDLFFKGNDRSHSNRSSSNYQNTTNTANTPKGVSQSQSNVYSKSKTEEPAPSSYQSTAKPSSNPAGSQSYQGANSGYSNSKGGSNSQYNYKSNSTWNYGSGQGPSQGQVQNPSSNPPINYPNTKLEPAQDQGSRRNVDQMPPVGAINRQSSQQMSLEENKGPSAQPNQRTGTLYPNATEPKSGLVENQRGVQRNIPEPNVENPSQSSQNQIRDPIKVKSEPMETETPKPTTNTQPNVTQSEPQKKSDVAPESKITVKQEASAQPPEGGESKEDPLKHKGMQKLLEMYIKNPNDERIKKMMEKVKSIK